jgi:hypothetical protein
MPTVPERNAEHRLERHASTVRLRRLPRHPAAATSAGATKSAMTSNQT